MRSEDLKVGDIIKVTNFSKRHYEVIEVTTEGVCLRNCENDNVMADVYDHAYNNRLFRNGHTAMYSTTVKDTRLARKMYPDYEVLNDGMLRIRS